jgi:hypothetical protein
MAAGMRWEAAAAAVLMPFLRVVVPAMCSAQPHQQHQQQRNGWGSMVPPANPAERQLKALLSRLASWAAGSAAAHQRRYLRCSNSSEDSRRGAWSPFIDDAGNELLQTTGDVRASLRSTAFLQLAVLWEVLEACGAPAVLSSDEELLQPLWTVVSACIEIGTGECGACCCWVF